MLALAVETSCDETSAAVAEDGHAVLSNVVSTQIPLHMAFGGVVPEIASRQHVRVITSVVDEALKAANVDKSQLDYVAATRGPGLAGALLVGVNFARALAFSLERPYRAINHLEGHLYSVWLHPKDEPAPAPEFPLLALIVSGGHTELVLMKRLGEYTRLGHTLDDAAGEAFDKVARLLRLPYPGGPEIERVAREATNPHRFPRAWLPGTYDFSFSGLKTAVLHATLTFDPHDDAARGRTFAQARSSQTMSPGDTANLAAGFQESVIDVLVRKTVAAAQALSVATIAVVGGVAANGALAAGMRTHAPCALLVARREYTTDNAAMIAAAAYFGQSVSENEGAAVVPNLALAVT